ncbi:MAG: 50S ribosomal protein L32e [Nitrososphaeraceae archaeon]|jgi:large subunit ribosomal protein L32e
MVESCLPINDELLRARKKVSATRPKFVRQESWRYVRLAENWRKPKGIDNKMRKQVSGVPPLVKVGYRGPKAARGLHPSGYRDRLIHNIRDLEKLDPKIDAARIGHSVGRRKRIDIVSKANALGIKVLNKGNAPQESIQKAQDKEQT